MRLVGAIESHTLMRACRLSVRSFFAIFLVAALASPLSAGSIKNLDAMQKTLLSREVMELSRNFVTATAALEEQLDEFNHFFTLSERAQVRAAIRDMERVEELHGRFEADGAALGDYLASNRKRLRQEGLDSLLPLSELTDESYSRFNDALHDYIGARKRLLHWAEDNYRTLSEGEGPAREEYEALFGECEKIMEKEYDRYLERIEFVKTFLQKHPELAAYVAR